MHNFPLTQLLLDYWKASKDWRIKPDYHKIQSTIRVAQKLSQEIKQRLKKHNIPGPIEFR